MKLRDHPALTNWPPTWRAMSGWHEHRWPGESAILTNVALSKVPPVTVCYLTVESEDESFTGALFCKDPLACRRMFEFLTQHIGKPVTEIADLELPFITSRPDIPHS
jgi:hypothetical protein